MHFFKKRKQSRWISTHHLKRPCGIFPLACSLIAKWWLILEKDILNLSGSWTPSFPASSTSCQHRKQPGWLHRTVADKAKTTNSVSLNGNWGLGAWGKHAPPRRLASSWRELSPALSSAFLLAQKTHPTSSVSFLWPRALSSSKWKGSFMQTRWVGEGPPVLCWEMTLKNATRSAERLRL